MGDGHKPTHSSLLGFPLPVSLAVAVALLGLIGLQVPGLKRAGPTDSNASPTESAVSGVPYDGHSPAIRVLAEAFGLRHPTESSKPVTEQSEGEGNAKGGDTAPTHYTAELKAIVAGQASDSANLPLASRCLIACLPDPNDSHFSMSFDNGLESIVRGFQKHGYVRDRYEMIWQNDSRLIRAGTQNFDKRAARDRASAILFRRTAKAEADAKGPREEYAMLLLVGETPTTGVHQRALHDAMSFVHALQSIESERAKASGEDTSTTDGSPANPDFRILGPTYSGSSNGLRRAIDQWRASPWVGLTSRPTKSFVRVISGSATAESNREIFGSNDELKTTTIDFSSTMATDDIVLDAVIKDFVNHRGVKPYQIAILSESDTSYGSELLSGPRGQSFSKNQQSLRGIGRLRYPMTLSRMRDEYSHRGNLGEPVNSQPEIIRRRNLDLALDLSPLSIDILPSFSPSSAAVAELVLESVLTAVQNDDIRVLGVLGTDVTDKLFLAQQIRKRCPELQLFTLESDFLFTHATYAPSLRGMIVASSYPLYPRTQSWSLPLGERDERLVAHADVQFASDTSQGTYNATVQLLNSAITTDATNQLRLDFGRVFSAEVSDDSLLAEHPPYGWLSMVGDTELFPLKQLDHPDRVPQIAEGVSYGRQHWVRTPQRLPMGLMILLTIPLGFVFWFWNGSTIPYPGQGGRQGLAASSWQREFFRSTRLFRLGGWRQPWFLSFLKGCFLATFFLGIGMILGAVSFAPLIHLIGFGLANDFEWLTQRWPRFAFWNQLVFFTWSLAFTSLLSCMFFALVRPYLFASLLTRFRRHGFQDLRLAAPASAEGQDRRGDVDIVSCLYASLVFYVVVLLCGWMLLSHFGKTSLLSGDKAWFALQISRTGIFGNLVNPTVPVLLLGGTFAIWGYCSLKRLQLVDDYGLSNPLVDLTQRDPEPDPAVEYAGQLAGIWRANEEISNAVCQLFSKNFRFTDVVAGTVVVVALHRALYSRWVGTYEGASYDILVRLLLAFAFFFVATFIFRVHKLLRASDRMLSRAGYLPLVDAFSRLPESVKSRAAGQLSCLRPDQGDIDGMLRKYDGLLELSADAVKEIGLPARQFQALSADASALLAERRQALAVGTGSGYVFAETRLPEKLAESTERLLVPPLLTHWQRFHDAQQAKRHCSAPPSERADGTGEPPPARWQCVALIDPNAEVLVAAVNHVDLNRQAPQAGEQTVPTDPRVGNWYCEVEELIAMQLTYQIRVIFLHIRNLLVGTTLMILLLFWAVNCYPFQPGTLLNFSCLVLLVWLLAIIFSGILRFNRNEILSRINGTAPNQLTFDSSFWAPIVSYIGLPILAVLATLMPSVGRALFGWTSSFGQMLSAGGN